MTHATRVHRLLKIIALIRAHPGMTPARLSTECSVGERQIFRDLNELQAAGIPIQFDHATGGYRVSGECFLPPVQLTPEEALAISVLCEHIAQTEQIPFTRPAWAALTKIHANLPESVRDDIGKLVGSMVVRTAQSVPSDGQTSVYEKIQHAIATRTALRCRYDSLNPETNDDEEFDFEPYALFFSVRAWYAVGYHAGRDAIRSLKLSRFTAITPTARPYKVPADFSLDAHLANAWRMMPSDRDYQIKIRFSPAFAETVTETRWHRTQQVEFEQDGSAIFQCTVSGLDEIVWWVLSMGPHCEVIYPPELRDRVRGLARDTAALYE